MVELFSLCLGMHGYVHVYVSVLSCVCLLLCVYMSACVFELFGYICSTGCRSFNISVYECG